MDKKVWFERAKSQIAMLGRQKEKLEAQLALVGEAGFNHLEAATRVRSCHQVIGLVRGIHGIMVDEGPLAEEQQRAFWEFENDLVGPLASITDSLMKKLCGTGGAGREEALP